MFPRPAFIAATVSVLILACTSTPVAPPDGTIDGLFAAERSFAKASTERGIRASFLEYFASDGIDFRPDPGAMRARALARPAPADPLALVLDWSPQAGAVASAGDLGFTTGPYSLRNQRDPRAPARYGYYFSVWKRENGAWRVAVDGGVSTPAAPAPDSLLVSVSDAGKSSPWLMPPALRGDRGKDALLALEREARSLDPDPADSPSYFALLANSVRILREGSYALIGADAAHRTFAATGRRVFWTPVGAGASASDDFGYTYGRFARFIGSAEEATGYYIHVWQRDSKGAWRIAAEVELPPG